MGELHRPVLGYLAGVVVLATAIFGMLVWLFLSRIPAFTDALVASPADALRTYPIAVLSIVGAFAGTLLLLVLVVGFGAQYGPDEMPKQ